MKYTYTIIGMHCNSCRTKVENALNELEGVKAIVTLDPPQAVISMQKPIQVTEFQEAISQAGKYTIKVFNPNDLKLPMDEVVEDSLSKNTPGKYYCPMHCEGDKEYDAAGDCPVCGMDLVQQPVLNQRTQYTCSMHPEVEQDSPGPCPICGMDLVPMTPDTSEESKAYDDLMNKMKIALLFTIPIFFIAMSDMIPNNPLLKILDYATWN